MADKHSTIESLLALLHGLSGKPCHSESAKRAIADEAKRAVWASDLPKADREAVFLAIGKAANPTGYYCNGTGLAEGIAALEGLLAPEPVALNPRNLRNIVSDGSIFSVEFVKRSDGSLRRMCCRVGVRKHLKGGKRAYSPRSHDLLSVYDLGVRDYRSIPLEGIRRLTVNGQTFSLTHAPA